jgi:dihydrofolate reductase
MGRKAQDFFQKPFVATRNVIFSKDKKYCKPNTHVIYNFENGLNILEFWKKELFFIGGNSTFKKAFPYCDKLYLTELQTTFENPDSFLPEIDPKEWKLVSEEFHEKDIWNEYDFKFKVYERLD